jgi:hypothetical protein
MDEKDIVVAILSLAAIVTMADGAWKRDAEAEKLYKEAMAWLDAFREKVDSMESIQTPEDK